jgi:hypothetical protein
LLLQRSCVEHRWPLPAGWWVGACLSLGVPSYALPPALNWQWNMVQGIDLSNLSCFTLSVPVTVFLALPRSTLASTVANYVLNSCHEASTSIFVACMSSCICHISLSNSLWKPSFMLCILLSDSSQRLWVLWSTGTRTSSTC